MKSTMTKDVQVYNIISKLEQNGILKTVDSLGIEANPYQEVWVNNKIMLQREWDTVYHKSSLLRMHVPTSIFPQRRLTPPRTQQNEWSSALARTQRIGSSECRMALPSWESVLLAKKGTGYKRTLPASSTAGGALWIVWLFPSKEHVAGKGREGTSGRWWQRRGQREEGGPFESFLLRSGVWGSGFGVWSLRRFPWLQRRESLRQIFGSTGLASP